MNLYYRVIFHYHIFHHLSIFSNYIQIHIRHLLHHLIFIKLNVDDILHLQNPDHKLGQSPHSHPNSHPHFNSHSYLSFTLTTLSYIIILSTLPHHLFITASLYIFKSHLHQVSSSRSPDHKHLDTTPNTIQMMRPYTIYYCLVAVI